MTSASSDHAAHTPTGLEFVRTLFATNEQSRGIGRAMGFKGKSVEFGSAVLEGFPSEDFYNPLGTVHGGYAATMLDAAIALAVHSTLPPRIGYATVDLKVTYLRPMSKDSGPIIAEGKVLHSGKELWPPRRGWSIVTESYVLMRPALACFCR